MKKQITILISFIPFICFCQSVIIDCPAHNATLEVHDTVRVGSLVGANPVWSDNTGTLKSAPYTEWVGLLDQSGTNTPTITELENTLGTTITCYRQGVGLYNIESPTLIWNPLKTVVLVGNPMNTNGFSNIISYNLANGYVVQLWIWNKTVTSLQDGNFYTPLPVTIRQYQ